MPVVASLWSEYFCNAAYTHFPNHHRIPESKISLYSDTYSAPVKAEAKNKLQINLGDEMGNHL